MASAPPAEPRLRGARGAVAAAGVLLVALVVAVAPLASGAGRQDDPRAA